jgi:hypothetical protein
LQRTILSRLHRINRSNSNNLTSHPRRSHGTRLRPSTRMVSRSTPFTDNPLLQVPSLPLPHQPLQHLPLARQPLQPLQQIRHRLGTCTIICPNCKALHWIEERSQKGTKQVPKFSTCCMNGAISLPQLPDAPILMEELLKDESNGTCHNS